MVSMFFITFRFHMHSMSFFSDGLGQNCDNSIATALELPLSHQFIEAESRMRQ